MFQSYEQISANMNEKINEMNRLRAATISKYIFGWLGLILGFIIPFVISAEPTAVLPLPSTLYGLPTDKLVRFISIPVLFIAVIWSFIFLIRTHSRFRHHFRDIIVREMVKQLIETCKLPKDYPGSELEWEYGINRKIGSFGISQSGLFIIKDHDKFTGHDRILGKIGLTEFDFSALTLYKRVTSGKQSERYKYKKKFRGILFLADFNKNFRGHTLLRDKKIRSFRHLKRYIWLLFNSIVHGKKLQRIHLESKDFERHFKTKTSHEIEARYILSPNLMERLVKFRKKRRNPIDISFRNSYIAIALSSKKYFYDPSIIRRMKNGQVKDVYDDLTFFFSIIEELNLNTRIWGK